MRELVIFSLKHVLVGRFTIRRVRRSRSTATRRPQLWQAMIGKSLAATLTVLTSMLFCAGASAQQQRASAVVDPYLQTVWTTEDGLPQNSVTGIVQSRDGYLWLSTFGGLARFDGVRFAIFNSANTPGLKSNRITALFEDRRGILWLGTETGELMSLEDGVGATFPMTGALQSAIVSSLTGDGAGVLWAGTTKGLARFQDGKFTAYTTADGLPDNRIYGVEQDQAGRLWMIANRNLVEFDGRQFVTHRFPDGVLGAPSARGVREGSGLPPRLASRCSSMGSLSCIRICHARPGIREPFSKTVREHSGSLTSPPSWSSDFKPGGSRHMR